MSQLTDLYHQVVNSATQPGSTRDWLNQNSWLAWVAVGLIGLLIVKVCF